MVQLMSPRKVTVKLDVDESSGTRLGPSHKRLKLDSSPQMPGDVDASVYHPLDEPSPLGLQLKKSPSFLDLIQMKLSQQKSDKLATLGKRSHKGAAASSAPDKLKAMNFPASLLRIGSWEYKSRYEGDLVAKCYFAKHKLVWEVLDGSLKNKMEIQWSDVVAIKANYPDDGPGSLDVVLARPPLFFRETNPQPRKHTLWQATSDFTAGQATLNRRHFLQCPQGLLLGKHFEKLIQCDPRLNFLSQQPEIVLESPFFDARVTVTGDLDDEYRHRFGSKIEEGSAISCLQESASPSGAHSSPLKNEQDFSGRAPESYSQEISSSASVMDTAGTSKMLSKFNQIKVPGLPSSMSVSDFVSHIGNCISGKEQPSSDMLEEITQYLFSDSQLPLPSDEQSLMSRVNSLYCLLQKDPSTDLNLQARSDDWSNGNNGRKAAETNSASASAYESKPVEGFPAPKGEPKDDSGDKQEVTIPRRDSFGELLLNLPRIASLPHFLFNLS
ncbi:hypothetical protein D8674_019606 [Pyrus ussuriensis x Pyrus communis]|uniref:TRF2/HOY1 PH-like domain-containing protein n=1 Tax=Pyrus ussuriensis x Pyrus communis TaxID=2448454 RepID=A0A5N5GLF9_9ROSA|nr:hypothetical protein D8674_019606 [Pyrus ussuriensis x Pyrus communis]